MSLSCCLKTDLVPHPPIAGMLNLRHIAYLIKQEIDSTSYF